MKCKACNKDYEPEEFLCDDCNASISQTVYEEDQQELRDLREKVKSYERTIELMKIDLSQKTTT